MFFMAGEVGEAVIRSQYAYHMLPILKRVKQNHRNNKSQLCSGLLAHKTDHQIKSQTK
jgi:mannose/fructose/N-acetylgalactosamine-specific phosphotransferase system component IID